MVELGSAKDFVEVVGWWIGQSIFWEAGLWCRLFRVG
jgi:hypothetical protein